ncbi:MAG: tetratricopeptide repeat protein [Candidatus Woesearchaeota archaeon]|nr:tetratricopeptide repeat protein [Nanoarchaeota archaeon]USN44324.1 MAG: tetratricopeptide repeat protein [Candidatus Woesearchaeota archaeon]
MAILGIVGNFSAKHGSRNIRTDPYSVEICFNGEIEDGFVNGIDHLMAKSSLEKTLLDLSNKYLDDIVGRATNEHIAQYIFYNLLHLNPQKVKVIENGRFYVEIEKSDMNINNYPINLSYEKARSLLFRGKIDEAEKELEKTLEIDRNFSKAYNLMGRCCREKNDFASALPLYEKAVELDADFGDAYRNIGNALYYLNRFNEMIPFFSKAVELMPNSALAVNNRGFAYQGLKEFGLALMDHKKAVELDPHYAEAHRDYAEVLKIQGNTMLAEKHFRIATKIEESKEDTYSEINKPMY